MEKYGTARQATNDNYNAAHTHCTVESKATYTHSE